MTAYRCKSQATRDVFLTQATQELMLAADIVWQRVSL